MNDTPPSYSSALDTSLVTWIKWEFVLLFLSALLYLFWLWPNPTSESAFAPQQSEERNLSTSSALMISELAPPTINTTLITLPSAERDQNKQQIEIPEPVIEELLEQQANHAIEVESTQ